MSSGHSILQLQPADAKKILAAKTHVGAINCNYQMSQYVSGRAPSGAHIFHIGKTWEKIVMAARIIATVENPQDVCVVSGKDLGQRAIIKFSKFIGGSSVNGRFSPGTFTNHSQAGYREPRLIVVTDPAVDHQAVREASYVNIPVIALCDVDTQLKYIDVAIPCNNRAPHSIGLIYWFLAREVQRLRGTVSRKEEWSVMPDLFFHRAAEDIRKQEEEEKKDAEPEVPAVETTEQDYQNDENWAADAAPAEGAAAEATTQEWAAGSGEGQGQQNWAAENDWNAGAAPSEWS